jgi:hypothetical protein
VAPSGNINNNNYDNNNGVRPFCITDSQSRHIAEIRKDTKKCASFRIAVNTKVFNKWIKRLFAIITTCTELIERLNRAKDLIAALHVFR